MRVSPVEQKIQEFEPGAVFSAIDFADVTDPHSASNRLQELAQRGAIKKVLRGIYWKPVPGESLMSENEPQERGSVAAQDNVFGDGTFFAAVSTNDNLPAIGEVADAIARSRRWTIVPTGETALNLLRDGRLDADSVTYLSSGPYVTYDLGDRQVVYKHASERSMGGDGFIPRLVVQCLRELRRQGRIGQGDPMADEQALGAIATRIPQYVVNDLPKSTRSAPAWMRPFVAAMPKLKERQILWKLERNHRVHEGQAQPEEQQNGPWDEFWLAGDDLTHEPSRIHETERLSPEPPLALREEPSKVLPESESSITLDTPASFDLDAIASAWRRDFDSMED